MDTTARTRPEIELRLRLRLVPRTDNRDALVELGFAPAYPQLAHDAYYGTLWTRAVEAPHDSAGHRSGPKMLVIERAVYGGAERPRRSASRRTRVCMNAVGRLFSDRPQRSRRSLAAASVLSVRTIRHRSPPDWVQPAKVGSCAED